MSTKDGNSSANTNTGSASGYDYTEIALASAQAIKAITSSVKTDSQKKELAKALRKSCGRRPAFSKKKKAEYEKCKADFLISVANRLKAEKGDADKVLPPTPDDEADSPKGNTVKIVAIVAVALAVVAGVVFLSKKKKN